ncbi:hypothetical protein CsSME_00048974 [Camellia sinensis var. sinensis]
MALDCATKLATYSAHAIDYLPLLPLLSGKHLEFIWNGGFFPPTPNEILNYS